MCSAVDGQGVINANVTVPLTTCGDTSLCCGSIDNWAGQDCCSHRKGLFIQDGKIVSTSSATSSATATPSATSSVMSSSTSSTTSTGSTATSQAKPASSNTGTIVGGVVGGVAGIVFLALAFWYFMIRRNLRQQPRPSQSYEPYQTSKGQIWQNPSEVPTYENGVGRGELDGMQTRTQELEGWQRNAT